MITRSIYCTNCNDNVEAEMVSGLDVYPHRPDLSKLRFYRCPVCANFVGTHKGTPRPLGCIPSPELKRARIAVHNKMDRLWKSKLIRRTALYSQISKMMGYTYHNGETRTVEECEKALKIIEQIESDLLINKIEKYM